MKHTNDRCGECGGLLATREERVEQRCERCIFARDWELMEAKRGYRLLMDAQYAQWAVEDRANVQPRQAAKGA